MFPQNEQVNEANPIVLSCDASGFPEPSFTWRKDGQVVSKSKQLKIQRSERGYSGIYACTASNGVGKDKTAKAYVTVQCKSITYHTTVVHVYPYNCSSSCNRGCREKKRLEIQFLTSKRWDETASTAHLYL